MTEHYLDRLASAINENRNSPALTDFYLTEDGSAQDISRGNHYTYGEMYIEMLRLGEIFAALGLKKGDHIAICGANSAHWAIAYLAIAAYQGVAVTILYSQAPEDIAHQIDFSDAKALFTDADLWAELKGKFLPQVEHVIRLEDWQLLKGKETKIINHKFEIINRDCHFSTGDINNLAMICFTSGSTGASKGVMLPYRSINVNNINNITCDLIENHKSNSRSFLAILPFAHMYGLMDNFITHITKGIHIHIACGIYTPQKLLLAIDEIQPFGLAITPAIFDGLLTSSRKQNINKWSSYLTYIEVGGASLSQETENVARNEGIPYFSGYGLSELGPHITSSTNVMRKGSCGTIARKLTARISPAGEILVKGENVMLGYYKDPEATARKIDSDGWLHTGDKGHLDEDGYLYVEGRIEQDMIVLPNGENIRPDNIESLINALPEVSESIVLARDGKLVAIVVPQITNQQSPLTNTDLRRMILRNVNPSLPLYSQLYDVEITDVPLQKTEKQTIKRYLYR